MTLNKPSGNMYPRTYTWNPFGGLCLHECSYCYVERLRQRGIKKYFGAPSVDEKAFNDDLTVPSGCIVFVQSCGDLLGHWMPHLWILRVLNYIKRFQQTTFLLQTKNPIRFNDFTIPTNCILGTTLETNRNYMLTKAPIPEKRYHDFVTATVPIGNHRIMVSIEPVLDFDMDIFLSWIDEIDPDYVSVGADSGNNKLPEPSPQKLMEFVAGLRKFTEVRLKKNLSRLKLWGTRRVF